MRFLEPRKCTKGPVMPHAIEVEIERNYAAFLDMRGGLMPAHSGRYALLHDQRLEGIFDTPAAAEREGYRRFAQDNYSIQLITDEPVDLGFYSYALPEG